MSEKRQTFVVQRQKTLGGTPRPSGPALPWDFNVKTFELSRGLSKA